MSFDVFFGVNVGKSWDFYKGSKDLWDFVSELLTILKCLDFQGVTDKL